MTEDRRAPSEMQEQSPSAAAISPAGEAITRRVLGRLGHSRGVIPPEAAEALPGQVARLAYGRLPLLDALQRRWGPSAVAWPNASDLPLATGREGAREEEIARRADAWPYPASPGRALPVVEAHLASHDRTTSDRLRGGFEGEAGSATSQSDVGRTASRFAEESGHFEPRAPLPVVKVSRSPTQAASASPALLHRVAGNKVESAGGLSGQPEPSERAVDSSPAPLGPAGDARPGSPSSAASRDDDVGAPRVAHLAPATAVTRHGISAGPPAQRPASETRERFARSVGGQHTSIAREESESISRAVSHATTHTTADGNARSDDFYRPGQPGATEVATTNPPIAKAAQTSVASRMPAPGVTRVWGEPIVQRARGHREAAAAEIAPTITGHTATSIQTIGAGTMLLHRLHDPEIETEMPASSPPVVRPEQAPGANTPRSGLGSGNAPGALSSGGSGLPVSAPIFRASVTSRVAGAQEAAKNNPRNATEAFAEVTRQSLPWSVGRQGSSSLVVSPAQQQESSSALPLLIQRQGGNTAGTVPAPVDAGGNQSAASPGASQTAALPEPTGAGRVRLDELEMERVANTVMELLRQRVQLEREVRGL